MEKATFSVAVNISFFRVTEISESLVTEQTTGHHPKTWIQLSATGFIMKD